jgi:hypothetical protein
VLERHRDGASISNVEIACLTDIIFAVGSEDFLAEPLPLDCLANGKLSPAHLWKAMTGYCAFLRI